MFFGWPARPVALALGMKSQRIGAARVFGQRLPSSKSGTPVGVEHDIFQHRAEALRGGEDLRLGLGRKPDRLGVAAAFEVEDAVRAPAMLVVADQRARRIGRQRRLAGARQAEEDRRVAVRPDIGRAMHRHDALCRQQVVERGEHRLLHLAGIGGAADQHDHAREVDGDHRFGAACRGAPDRRGRTAGR